VDIVEPIPILLPKSSQVTVSDCKKDS